MVPLPPVNWWPGNLRQNESKLSFLARFCELNGLDARRCMKVLDVDPENDAPLPGDAIARLSSVLREPCRWSRAYSHRPRASWVAGATVRRRPSESGI